VQFLDRIETNFPPDMAETQCDALLAAEAERGSELLQAGTIQAIWRLPGRLANVGIWDTPTTDALHEALVSLPLARWMTVDVTPLARHPLTDGEAV
jgi:muconolactone D-isomerase